MFCLLWRHRHRIDSSLTIDWKSRAAFLRDMLQPVVCTLVEKDSYYNRIMTPNTPPHFARTTLRPKKTKESWLSWTFLHSHLTSLYIYGSTWRQRKPSSLWHHKKLFEKLSNNIRHQVFNEIVESMPARVHAVSKAIGGHAKFKIFSNSITFVKDSTFHSNS